MTTKPLSEVLVDYPQLVGPTGPGVAAGGTTGQMLTKVSNTDYDTHWVDQPATGGGATWALAGSWTYSGTAVANVNFTGLTGMTDLLIIGQSLTLDTSQIVSLYYSVDNGASFFQTTGNYQATVQGGSTPVNVPYAGQLWNGISTGPRSGYARGYAMNVAAPRITAHMGSNGSILFLASNSPVNAIQLRPGAGNINGGSIYVFTR